MVFDFGALPPEINSGRIYAGRARHRCWPPRRLGTRWRVSCRPRRRRTDPHRRADQQLAGTLFAGRGDAGAPYTAWLSNTAAQAEQTASQAQAAAAAYEAAFAASIPPPVIAANRALLAALVATNFLGVNTPAIAATEAAYAEFWAQDAGAMYALCRRGEHRESADAVHRGAGDHQRQRAGHPGGRTAQSAAARPPIRPPTASRRS